MTRWFVMEIPVSSLEVCKIVGNCKTEKLAGDLVVALEAQSDGLFRVVGPITQNMIEGKLNPEDFKIAVAHAEYLECLQTGKQLH